jgi:hypothetical protein
MNVFVRFFNTHPEVKANLVNLFSTKNILAGIIMLVFIALAFWAVNGYFNRRKSDKRMRLINKIRLIKQNFLEGIKTIGVVETIPESVFDKIAASLAALLQFQYAKESAQAFGIYNAVIILWFLAGVLLLAWSRKKKKKKYKGILLVGVGFCLIYALLVARITYAFLHPIYYL